MANSYDTTDIKFFLPKHLIPENLEAFLRSYYTEVAIVHSGVYKYEFLICTLHWRGSVPSPEVMFTLGYMTQFWIKAANNVYGG